MSRRSDRATATAPDVRGLERAFERFLRAAKVPDDPELAQTPQRAAEAWATEFLDGYSHDATWALGELSKAPRHGGLVVVRDLDYVGVCPHHLLPYRGVAHLAYRPKNHVAGFGRLATLVDVLAHRLTLQEKLAAQLVDALVGVLGATGAAAILEADQTCFSLRGEHRLRHRAFVEASAGRHGADALVRLRKVRA